MIDRVPFDAFYYSLDWHPQDHISFIDNVKLRKLDADSKVTLSTSNYKIQLHEYSSIFIWYILAIFLLKIQDAEKVKTMDVVVFEGPPKTEQVMWPTHCVQESWGAEMHKDLKVILLPILFRNSWILLFHFLTLERLWLTLFKL